MARPRSPKNTAADDADREVGKAIESVQQELDGALGLVSVGALGSLPLMALRRVMPAWLLAVLVAGGSATGAAVLGRAGFSRLSAIAPEALEERAKEAVETVAEAVK
jgi:hypothetical protein